MPDLAVKYDKQRWQLTTTARNHVSSLYACWEIGAMSRPMPEARSIDIDRLALNWFNNIGDIAEGGEVFLAQFRQYCCANPVLCCQALYHAHYVRISHKLGQEGA